MLTRKQKIKYLLDSVLASGQRKSCSFCGSSDCIEIDRKYYVTKLLECRNCHLYFRYPVDKKGENENFYQTEYQESDNITTDVPDAAQLEFMKKDGFRSTGKNAEIHLEWFARLFPGEKSLRIIDYGSSWGYTTYQFSKAGHEVQGYDISRYRAGYGVTHLGVDICVDEKQLRKGNQIFFSSHVIEHHPDIASMIQLAKSLLVEGGYFIALCPNGSAAFRRNNPEIFHRFWGKVHPNYLNVDFYKGLFRNNPCYILSGPVIPEHLRSLQKGESVIGDLSGEELIVIAKM